MTTTHHPLTDTELRAIERGALAGVTSYRLATWVPQLVAEVREARRLLRAVQRSNQIHEHDDGLDAEVVAQLWDYLAACKRTNHGM